MSDTTNISFADHTGSPWIGCTKVNTDCIHCYADELDRNRFSKTLGGGTKENPIRHWGKGAARLRTKGFWTAAINWNRRPWICNVCGRASDLHYDHSCTGRKEDACHTLNVTWHRARVFPSLCDWLDREVETSWRVDFLYTVFRTQELDWMLFTKRPEAFLPCLREALSFVDNSGNFPQEFGNWLQNWSGFIRPPQNVWVFASAGCQQTYDQMIDHLQAITAVIRGISCEPMTGPVDFAFEADPDRPNVVIFGGESGPCARPCDIDWIEDGVMQCQGSGVLPYVKQLGSRPIFEGHPVLQKHPKGGDINQWPEHLRVQELPVVPR